MSQPNTVPQGGASAVLAALSTNEVIDRIFKSPGVQYDLTEFSNFGKPIHQVLSIYPKPATKGKDAGKTKYFLKSFVPSDGSKEYQVYDEESKSAPEEIVRQLWLYKLHHEYGYSYDQMNLEVTVHFGTQVLSKAADVIVYTDATKVTPKVVVETKKPKLTDGVEQLRSYMNAKGAPVALWSNGSERVILYRPYPGDFDTLRDLPKVDQQPIDVMQQAITLSDLATSFNFRKIIQQLEELVLANSGVDEFSEIFKLIFAKLWDEKNAQDNRPDQEVSFRKSQDPEVTYQRINDLFHHACEEWSGIFAETDNIDLSVEHLQVCVGPVEGVRLMGSRLRIMDDAFEYLLPTEAKKKKGQFFTPRHVVEMCVRMLNPTQKEHVMDPACGSGGFLLHTMDWSYPATGTAQLEKRKNNYASKYLWGIDFEQRAAKTSRALMLIAGDGHTNIFGPDVSSLDPGSWRSSASGQTLVQRLRERKLTAKPVPANETFSDTQRYWDYFKELSFNVVLANPPFAGEMRDRPMLRHYDLARPALERAGDRRQAKEERDVLFIERILDTLKPGGRAAIVLPQGKFNNASLSFIRAWLIKRVRLLAVVGLHQNTFKPHTGTKTSVLVLQKYTKEELAGIDKVQDEVAGKVPDYEGLIEALLADNAYPDDIPSSTIPDEVVRLFDESFSTEDDSAVDGVDGADGDGGSESTGIVDTTSIGEFVTRLDALHAQLADAEALRATIDEGPAMLAIQQAQEITNFEAAWNGDAQERKAQLKSLKDVHRDALSQLKDERKELLKPISAAAKGLGEEVAELDVKVKQLTNRGRLELVLSEASLVTKLKEDWIAVEVAKQLDYPIFMAVSERGGKDNSGNYIYVLDESGSIVVFPEGHRQAGQPVIDQDLVNFDLTKDDLVNSSRLNSGQVCIAEAFVQFAQKQGFDFWAAT